MEQIYLDNAATTPLAPEVAQAMRPIFDAVFGNPSSVHRTGQAARKAVEGARRVVAAAIGADDAEIVFTSGGTEANFLALFGILRGTGKRHVVTTSIEHHAVLHACGLLEEMGYEVTRVAPQSDGIVRPDAVLDAVRPDTGLVSVMAVNNETGAIQPIGELAHGLQARSVAFHSDAVQAFGSMPIDVKAVPVSSLSVSGHKIYGPKGVGALYLRKGTPFQSMIRGGAQERNRRAGTENVAAIVGFAKAVELLTAEREARLERMRSLRTRFLRGLMEAVKGVEIITPEAAVPNIINVAIDGVSAETLLMALDLRGVAASSGSACTAGSLEPSHVLEAMGMARATIGSSVRFSFSSANHVEEIDRAISHIKESVAGIRAKTGTV